MLTDPRKSILNQTSITVYSDLCHIELLDWPLDSFLDILKKGKKKYFERFVFVMINSQNGDSLKLVVVAFGYLSTCVTVYDDYFDE